MSRKISLDRLREISKERSIRRPLLVPVPDEAPGDDREIVPTKVEWPVAR